MRRKIKDNVLKRLFAHSGNQCACPDCTLPIFEDNGVLTGECCHIEAASEGGPRYNSNMSDEERNGYDNLVLLCSRHHTIIDACPEEYTVEKLLNIKREHERQYNIENRTLTNEMIQQLQVEIQSYWNRLYAIDQEDEVGLKMMIEPKTIDELLSSVEESFEHLKEILDSFAESDNCLMEDIKKECKKVGIDISLLDSISYYENSLINRNWENHNLAVPNFCNHLTMCYYQLLVKIYEEFASNQTLNEQQKTHFDFVKGKLYDFQINNYYVD